MTSLRHLVRGLAHASVATIVLTAGALAQQPPVKPPASGNLNLPPGVNPSNAAQLLASRPELGNVIRRRLRDSGLTPDQIRARLRAAGYPSTLLDAYISADSTSAPPPNENMVSA